MGDVGVLITLLRNFSIPPTDTGGGGGGGCVGGALGRRGGGLLQVNVWGGYGLNKKRRRGEKPGGQLDCQDAAFHARWLSPFICRSPARGGRG